MTITPTSPTAAHTHDYTCASLSLSCVCVCDNRRVAKDVRRQVQRKVDLGDDFDLGNPQPHTENSRTAAGPCVYVCVVTGKIVKDAGMEIERGLKYQLATGNWGKNREGQTVRTGVSQVGTSLPSPLSATGHQNVPSMCVCSIRCSIGSHLPHSCPTYGGSTRRSAERANSPSHGLCAHSCLPACVPADV